MITLFSEFVFVAYFAHHLCDIIHHLHYKDTTENQKISRVISRTKKETRKSFFFIENHYACFLL